MAMNSQTHIEDTISFEMIHGSEPAKIERYIKDLKVAILHTDYSGTGWYTSHKIYELLFDSVIAKKVEERDAEAFLNHGPYDDDIISYVIGNYSVDTLSIELAVPSLAIKWVDIGDKYRVVKVDGREVVELLTDTVWFEA